MTKNVAVIVRDRQGEALRVSVGLTISDNKVDVYVLDRMVEPTDENKMNLMMLDELGLRVYTNSKDNPGLTYLSTEEMARKLTAYDAVIVY